MKILIICGSPRKDSLIKMLTDIAYEYAKEYGEVDYLYLSKTRINNFEGFEKDYDPVTKTAIDIVKTAEYIYYRISGI